MNISICHANSVLKLSQPPPAPPPPPPPPKKNIPHNPEQTAYPGAGYSSSENFQNFQSSQEKTAKVYNFS